MRENSTSTLSAVTDELRHASDAREALSIRATALSKAARLLEGRLHHPHEQELLTKAIETSERAKNRLSLSVAHTVVALGGSTGSGKSSLFNALSGLELSTVGVRRPLTNSPYACIWGPEGADALLSWLEVPLDRRTARESVLDADSEVRLRGLILLDLPDHDSALVGHRLQVDRFVDSVDMIMWVVDPQKYADAALHERYLRQLAHNQMAVVVALNQADRLDDRERESVLTDLQRLVAADGLDDTRVITTSATRGDGLSELRAFLAEAVASREVALRRLCADVDMLAKSLAKFAGPPVRIDIERSELTALHRTLAEAVSVPAIAEAAEAHYRARAIARTSWPLLRGMTRFRVDPVRRLVETVGAAEARGASPGSMYRALADQDGTGAGTESLVDELADSATVHEAHMESAVRTLADHASVELPAPWPVRLRSAALSRLPRLPAALARAVSGADTGSRRVPAWWRVVNAAQWLLFATMLVGAVWLVGSVVGAAFGQHVPAVSALAVPLSAWLFIGGLVAGIALALVCRWWVIKGAHAARKRAEDALVRAVTATAADHVLAPLRAELTAYANTRDAILRAQNQDLVATADT